MRVYQTDDLFAWHRLDDSPSLQTIRRLLQSVPDGRLLESLRRGRGRGRNDYPVEVLWGVELLTRILRHTSTEACLAELRRNEPLRRLIGIQSEDGVPKKWNMSRFQQTLGREPYRSQRQWIFDQMIRRLGLVVDDLGQSTAGDSTALHARRSSQQPGASDPDAASGLPQPTGGRKEYLDEQGSVSRVYEWFGYKLHLLVDVQHELALTYRITSATDDDGSTLPMLVDQAQAVLPPQRMRTLAYDKAADSGDVHQMLHQRRIKPLIQTRALWKQEPERMLPGHDGNSNVVYDEAGTIYCYNRTSDPPVRQRMAFIGHEPARHTIKYRCPARHEGWTCPSEAVCNAGKQYGKTVRVDCTIDLRRFPPIPRATKKFERLYKGRTAVERTNARLKIFWGADDGNIVGAERFDAAVGLTLIVHAAFATVLAMQARQAPGSSAKKHTLGRISLSPIAKRLREQIGWEQPPAA
jgi:hypothetical protein